MVLPSTQLGGEHFQQHPLKAAVGRWDQMSTETAKAENRLPNRATLWCGFLLSPVGADQRVCLPPDLDAPKGTPLRMELCLG